MTIGHRAAALVHPANIGTRVGPCTFHLTPDDPALYDKDLNRLIEPGRFRVRIDSSSQEIRLMGELAVQ